MIIELPFVYTAKALPYRARNVRDVRVLDRIALNIREAAPEELPLVARFTGRFEQWPSEVRACGKGFVWPFDMTRGDSSSAPKPLPAEGLERMASEGGRTPFHSLPRLQFRGEAVPVADLREPAYRVQSDDRREMVAALVERASRIVVSGGVVFEACREPCWKKVQGWRVEPAMPTAEEFEREPDSYWRADKLHELAARHPDDIPPEIVGGGIEVFRPDLLRLCPEAPALRQRVKECLENGYTFGERFLRDATKEQFAIYADLRDAWKASGGEVTEELVDAVRAVLDSMEVTRHGSLDRLDEAFERWRAAVVADTADIRCDAEALRKLGR